MIFQAGTMTGFSKTIARAAIPAIMAAMVAGTAPAAEGVSGAAGPYLAAFHASAIGDAAAAARFYSEALAYDPDNPRLLESALVHQIAAGNIKKGIELARRFEKIEPHHHLGVLALAAEKLKAGDPAAAAALLAEDAPFVGQIMAAWAVYAEGAPEKAIGLLSDLAATSENGRPGQIVAGYHLGLMQAATGDDEAAVDSFAHVAELSDGGTFRLARLRAGALARLGRKDEAVAVIRDRLGESFGDHALADLAAKIADGHAPEPLVTTAAEGSAEVLYGVSGLLARGQNRLIALAYSQLAIWLGPDQSGARLLVAQILHGDGQYEQAIAAYGAVPKTAPEALTARIGKAQALEDAGRIEDALAALQALAGQFPDAIRAHTALGDLLRRESRFEEASEAYSKAIALLGDESGPQYWTLFYQRGITLERSGQWEKAEADFRKALELEPNQPNVLNYLGYSWVDRGENLAEAEAMIRKAVEQRPNDGYIVDSLGWVLYRFGEFEKAVKQLEHAVELVPVDPVINDHYGDALWMVGRKSQARFQWKRALSFDPTEENAARIRAKLEKGLDTVLASEEAAGDPAIIGRAVLTDETPGEKPKNGG